MAVFNLGSINEDHFYRVAHLPRPGETLAARHLHVGLGGKGANQSVAAARAGARVVHIGAIGPGGGWTRETLAETGVDITHVAEVSEPTAHAIINVDDKGENAIVIYSGANLKITLTQVKAALNEACEGDILLLQNETSLQLETAMEGRARGMFVIYSAAPFEAAQARAMLPHLDLLVMNDIEAGQLTESLGQPLDSLSLPNLLITQGAEGAAWHRGEAVDRVEAFQVTPVDTTGAGDCYIGTVAAGLDAGLAPPDAMRRAAAASAIQVTRAGTSEAIPTRDEVDAFLAERGAP